MVNCGCVTKNLMYIYVAVVVSHNTTMIKLDLPSPIIIKQHLLEDKQGEDENRNAQAAIKQDYSNSTATVQPRCGDERDSFQLGVEAVCRPGTPEQW